MSVTKKIIIRLLYFTPIGYILNILSLLDEQNANGIFIRMNKKDPIRAFIKINYSSKDRMDWFINGLVLLIEVALILILATSETYALMYAFLAFIFGIVNVISALFPKTQWNKRILQSQS